MATAQERTGLGFLTGIPVKVSWGAIFAGAVAALGLWALLYILGLAVGLSSINPQDVSSARFTGIFTGIWSLIAPLVALFVGGLVTSRVAGAMTKPVGAIHGIVLWGLTTLVGLWLLGNLVSALLGGVFAVGRTAVEATGGAVVAGAGQAGQVAQRFGLNAEDALAPINQRLRAQGRPAITAAQLEAAVRDVVQTAVQQGRLDRALLVQSIAEQTALSRTDAEEVASRVEAQLTAFRTQAGQTLGGAAQQVQTGALQAADVTGKALWWVFGSLLLGLISAVLGATLGVSKTQRMQAGGAVVTAPPEGPIPPRREVHP